MLKKGWWLFHNRRQQIFGKGTIHCVKRFSICSVGVRKGKEGVACGECPFVEVDEEVLEKSANSG